MKLRDYIFCDDVRREVNNKFSLNGVYGDRIIIKPTDPSKPITWPVPLRLYIVMRFDIEGTDSPPESYAFTFFLNDKKLGETSAGPLNPDKESTIANLIIAAEGLPLEPGTLGFSIQVKRGDTEMLAVTVTKAIKIVK